MKKEEAVVFLRNHGHQAMIENGVVMIIMAQNRSTVKKIGRFLREAGYHSSYGSCSNRMLGFYRGDNCSSLIRGSGGRGEHEIDKRHRDHHEGHEDL